MSASAMSSGGRGLARKLMERLAMDSRNQGLLSLELHCRRDFDANAMWGNLGFIPWGEKPGRAKSGTTLTLWRRELAQSNQMPLVFDGAGHGEIDVVMDAQVVFDLETPDDDGPAAPSKAHPFRLPHGRIESQDHGRNAGGD